MIRALLLCLPVSVLLLGVLVGRASAEDVEITSAVEQSSSLSMMQKISFVQGAVSGTEGWIAGLESQKEKVLKDRALDDEERKAILACYDRVLTPLRSLLEVIRKSGNTMQAYFANGDEVHADLEFRRVAVVYKLATEKQAESIVCTAGTDESSGEQVTSMEEPESAMGMDEVVVPPNVDVSPT